MYSFRFREYIKQHRGCLYFKTFHAHKGPKGSNARSLIMIDGKRLSVMSVLSCPVLSCPVLLRSGLSGRSYLSGLSCLSSLSYLSGLSVWSGLFLSCLSCRVLVCLVCLVWSGLVCLVWSTSVLGGSSRGYCSNLVCLVWFCLFGRVSWGRLSSS